MVLACTALYVVTLGWALSAADGQGNGREKDGLNPNQSERARIAIGFEIAPVPLDLAGKDSDLVGLGSYIVNAAGGCNDCHTWPNYAPGHDPFAGEPKQVNVTHYLAGGRDFGPFISRNLTRVPEAHTVEDFIRTMRTGVDLHNPAQLLQVMPWPVYQDLTDHDLRAIYEYLRAIPDAARCPSVGPISPAQPDPTCVP
jgi:hypothetical protein